MANQGLQSAIDQQGSAVEVLRNARSRPFTFPVTPEFTNWRREQASWRDSCALLDQSPHMADLFVSGPGATEFFTSVAGCIHCHGRIQSKSRRQERFSASCWLLALAGGQSLLTTPAMASAADCHCLCLKCCLRSRVRRFARSGIPRC